MNQLPLDLQPIQPSYRLIPLTKGKSTKVSPHRFDYLNQWRWHATFNPLNSAHYAVRVATDENGKQHTVIMARVILNAPKGALADHINRDTLDNRDENLRLATPAQNAYNRPKRKDSKWPYRGVYQIRGRWCATIQAKGVSYFLGGFDTAEDARDAYIEAAHSCHEGYACFDASKAPTSVHDSLAVVGKRPKGMRKGPRPIRPDINQPDDPLTRHLALTRGFVAIIDAVEYEWASKYNWVGGFNKFTGLCYATRSDYTNKVKSTIWLHKEILGVGPGTIVDHINGNTLDCRRENLRIATRDENNRNHRVRKDSVSGIKGAVPSTCCKGRPWRSMIRANNKIYHLGYFATSEEANAAYRKAADELHGEFANY